MGWLRRFQQWLFRYGDDRGTVVLSQRRIFILPTGFGIAYAFCLAVMLLAAINYGLSLGHALVFLLVGIGLVAMLETFRGLFGLAIDGGRPTPVFAGGTARFPLHLSNRGKAPRVGLRFSAGSGDVDATLAAGARATVDVPVHAPRRGWLRAGRITLDTRYPLGLFRAWSYLQPATRCLVYPRPLARPRPQPPAEADRADETGSTSGREDFAGLRARQPSDPPRHVAWKAAARTDARAPLQVKQFSGGGRTECWLDWHTLPEGLDEETRLSVLAGWVLDADARGERYGLRIPGRKLEPADGSGQRDACLEALALFGLPADG